MVVCPTEINQTNCFLFIYFKNIHQTLDPSTLCGSVDSRFSIISEVGCGCYGSVFKAIDRANNEIVALKKVKVFDKEMSLPQAFYREKKVFDTVKHDNVLNMKEVFRCKKDNALYFVMEFCEYDLSSLIHDSRTGMLSISKVRSLFKQLLHGVAALHSKGFIHRDIKPSNILINKKNILKLIDFGLSRQANPSTQPLTHNVVSPSYKAPEIIFGDPNYGFSSDIWSLGCVLFELITGLVLFRPKSHSDFSQLSAISSILGKPSHEEWPSLSSLPGSFLVNMGNDSRSVLSDLLDSKLPDEFAMAKSLIMQMLVYDPSKRISIEEALQHPFLSCSNFELPPHCFSCFETPYSHPTSMSPMTYRYNEKIEFRPLRAEPELTISPI